VNIAEKIKGSEKLTESFGEWPSFHDAEVLTFEMDRNGPTIRSSIDVFATTSELDPQGFYVLKNRSTANLRFDGVTNFSAKWLNSQNVLFELAIVDISDPQLEEGVRFEVTFDESFGLHAEFLCRSVEVESVVPFQAATQNHCSRT
jgi:hypothetical protein